jgi:hypothetical protein
MCFQIIKRKSVLVTTVSACFVFPITLSHYAIGAEVTATPLSAADLNTHPEQLSFGAMDHSTIAKTPVVTDQRVWTCRAESSDRIYLIENLRESDRMFTLNIYQTHEGHAPKRFTLLAAIPIQVGEWTQELQFVVNEGTDQLRVNAFGRTPAFSVERIGKDRELIVGRCWS